MAATPPSASWQHTTVLLVEAVDALLTDPGGIYVDATFGRGGHSRRLLASLSPSARLVAFDRDPEHAAAFLLRHQDKLMLGTDCSDPVGQGEKCSGSGQIANVRKYVTDPAVRAKIFSGNAKRILKIS